MGQLPRKNRPRKEVNVLRVLKHHHHWAPCALGMYCSDCRVVCRTPAAFQQKVYMPCRAFEGVNGGRFHSTHKLMCSSGVHWCIECGAFAAVRMDKLAAPCYKVTGAPLTIAMKRQLMLLKSGIYPSNLSVFLGYPDDPTDNVGSTFNNFAQLLGEQVPPWARYANTMLLFRWQSNPEWLAFHLSFPPRAANL